MKKIGVVVFIIIIIVAIFKSDNTKQKNVAEQNLVEYQENEIKQNNTESEKIILNEGEPQIVQATNPLDGKTIALIGDSLIEGYGNDNKGVDYYLAKKLPNTNFINHSNIGSTITDNSGTDNIVMINQARTLAGNPDMIVFDGGANDIMGYALGFLNQDLKKEIGTIDTNTTTISNGDTVMNDLEEVVLELKNRFPNAKLCYVQPFLLDDDTIYHLTNDPNQITEIQARRDNFYAQVQKMCTKWNIKYIDVSKHFVGTGTTYRQEDWIHIKEAGYQLITPFILEGLKEIYN